MKKIDCRALLARPQGPNTQHIKATQMFSCVASSAGLAVQAASPTQPKAVCIVQEIDEVCTIE